MGKRVLVPLAEGFEMVEALSVVDILRRGNIQVDTAALGDVFPWCHRFCR
jgi:4-methyl-5(b-hydroxyethyl)-thiazole monophosphate biosynthesis